MRVCVQPYDPEWALKFEEEASLLRQHLGPNFISAHHIGSTAVPTIFAKPIIDLLLFVNEISTLNDQVSGIPDASYEAMGEYGIAGRRYFRKYDSAGMRTHHVHAYQTGNAEVLRHLAFRDFLLAHPDVAQEYSALKRRLASDHPNDMVAYVAGKESFIRDVEAKALAWSRTA